MGAEVILKVLLRVHLRGRIFQMPGMRNLRNPSETFLLHIQSDKAVKPFGRKSHIESHWAPELKGSVQNVQRRQIVQV